MIQPWALLLNGLTAIAGAIAFWKAGMVDKRGALILIIVTTIGAPIGVWLLQFASTDLVWWLYVGVLVFLAVPDAAAEAAPRPRTSPRSPTRTAPRPPSPPRRSRVFAGFLGVGPGLPADAHAHDRRLHRAARRGHELGRRHGPVLLGLHLAPAARRTFDWPTVIVTSIAAMLGAWLGARFTAGQVKSATLSRIFAVALIFLAAQRAWILLT